jgi:hypothetical protein
VGVVLLVWCIYSALFAPVFFNASFASVFAAAMHGAIPIRWTGTAIIGLLALFGGLLRIRREGHELQPGSVLWSVLVVAVIGYWLLHVSPLSTFEFHVLRMLLVGWGVSNAFNLWLQFHFRRRSAPAERPVPVARVPRLVRRRRVSTEWVEEFQGHGFEGVGQFPWSNTPSVHLPPGVSPDMIAHNGAPPQITYVRHGDTFIPVQMSGAVRERRR